MLQRSNAVYDAIASSLSLLIIYINKEKYSILVGEEKSCHNDNLY